MPRIETAGGAPQPQTTPTPTQHTPQNYMPHVTTPTHSAFRAKSFSHRGSGVSFSDTSPTLESPRAPDPLPSIDAPKTDISFYEDVGRKVVHLLLPLVQQVSSDSSGGAFSKIQLEELARVREENDSLRHHLFKPSARPSANCPDRPLLPTGGPFSMAMVPVTSERFVGLGSSDMQTSSAHEHWNVVGINKSKTFSVKSFSTRSFVFGSEVLGSTSWNHQASAGRSSAAHLTVKHQSSAPSNPSIHGSAQGSVPSSTGRGSVEGSVVGTASRNMRSSVAHREKKDKLMQVFSVLDGDGSGCIATEELRHALRKMGESPAHARRLMAMADRNRDGSLDRDEWEAIVDDLVQGNPISPALNFAEDCLKLYDADEKHHLNRQTTTVIPLAACLISYRSGFRISWDIFLALWLIYIAILTPFEMGFVEDEDDVLKVTGLSMDICFLLDVILNFRTTYVDVNGNYITDGRKIALHYLRTWFFIDLISSLPLDYMSSNWLPNMAALKFGKSGKLFKIVKMWRLTKVAQIFWVSHAIEVVNDFLAVTGCITVIYMMAVISGAVLVCHWLACFSAFVAEEGFLEGYLNGQFAASDPSTASRYLAAQYWAVTTMTTVGYGDITPRTDSERAFAISGMISGCAFYSYLIGYMAVVVGNRNLNEQAYQHRLREVRAWMDHHSFSKEMRHRIWRYFKLHLKMKSLHENFTIIQELSPELRQAVCFTIVHEDVRLNPIFDGVPPVVMTILANIVKRVMSDTEEPITSYGDYGFAMCCILSGTAVIERNGRTVKTRQDCLSLLEECTDSQVMLPSDSFGEEIVLGLERHYKYSVVSASKVQMAMIPADDFLENFSAMPDIVRKMRYNFMGDHDHPDDELAHAQNGDRQVHECVGVV